MGIAASAIQFIVFAVSIEKTDQAEPVCRVRIFEGVECNGNLSSVRKAIAKHGVLIAKPIVWFEPAVEASRQKIRGRLMEVVNGDIGSTAFPLFH